MVFSAMAATTSCMVSAKISMLGYMGKRRQVSKRRAFSISAQQESQTQESQEVKAQEEQELKQEKVKQQGRTTPRPVEPQLNVKSKNMGREYGGQWLSCTTRHVRIFAAYIDPVTSEFDQTQMDKLTFILDPTNEFVWSEDSCTKVYSYFQELVDHYEVKMFSYISIYLHWNCMSLKFG